MSPASPTFRFLASALFLISSLGSVGEAKTPIELQVLEKVQEENPSLFQQSMPKIAPLCANFTGEWEGTCVVQGSSITHSSTKSISQSNCKQITFDGNTYDINGLETTQHGFGANSDKNNVSSAMSIAYAWNGSQTRLNSLTQFTALAGPGLGVIAVKSMWLEGDQLLTHDSPKSMLIGIDGSPVGRLMREDCTYNRVAHP